MRRALPGAEDPRLPASLRRRGGRGGRRDAGARAARRGRRHLPRAWPGARARRADGRADGRDVRQAAKAAAAAAAARCTSSTATGASSAATPSSAAGCRWRSASRWPTSGCSAGAVTACFFGEGAVGEGEFHESMNLAALWRLPVLFVCENNLYAMGMPLEIAEAETEIWHKAAGLPHAGRAGGRHGPGRGGGRGAPRRRAHPRGRRAALPGMPHLPLPRPFDVRRPALPHAGRDRGLEAARPDPAPARLDERSTTCSPTRTCERIEAEVAAEIDAAVAFAEAGTLEPVEELERFVLMDEVPAGAPP